jgi:beta-glucosidase
LIIDNWKTHAMAIDQKAMPLEAGKTYRVRLEYFQGTGEAIVQLGWRPPVGDELAAAVTLARNSDAAIIFTGLGEDYEAESFDRATLELSFAQRELIRQVSAVNPNTIVVLNSGSAMLLDNVLSPVSAVIHAWYPGQEGGVALARVIAGDVSPSGKLPITWMKREEDTSSFKSYPGQNGELKYTEGVFVGYRHFDKDGIEPLFPFGHGLTYAQFQLSPCARHQSKQTASC